MSMNQEALTIEETNKVRESLGLAPIGGAPTDGAEVEPDATDVAEANYAERREEMRRAKAEADIKEKIARQRNRSALNAKMKGSTLGDVNADDSLDTKSWIKKQKKREKLRAKEMAERRAKEMEEQDKAVYDETDLTGLKVGHDADDFEEGQDVILTLKDSRVLEGDEDELQNVNLADDAAVKAAKERKRKAAAQYTGYDDEEFDENRIGVKADVLGKYDDEFTSGKAKSDGFRLGAPIEKKMVITDEDTEMGMAPATRVKLNLDYAKEFEVSDYAKEGEAGFKKPKKKKAKRSTRRAEADGEDENGMEVDGEPTFSRRVTTDGPDNLVDDDDLQAALARTRRENAKKKPKVKLEDMAAQIAQQRQEEDAAPADEGEEDGRITFDDTSEFVRNVTLESLAAPVKRERAATPSGPSASTSTAIQEPVVVKIERNEDGEVDEDEDMSDDEDDALAEMAAREGLSLEEYRLKIDAQLHEIENIKTEEQGIPSDSEPVIGSGVAGILSMLRNQGAIKTRTAEDEERERIQKEKDLWLADHRRRTAQREYERIMARGGNKDQAQREYENRMREQQEARDALDSYKGYKPDINIVYHDEFGRNMTPKEAWKSLSHKFHGKTSGRMKTEKRLKKIAEERKQLTMNATDTPLGMTDAFSRRQAKTGEAHMVLSVGNKGSVMQGNKSRR